MKKIICLICMILAFWITPVFAGSINVMVDNNQVKFLSEPVIKNGTTLVPMRQIFESLGASIDWNQSSKQVTSKINNDTLILTVDSNIAKLNGSNITLNAAPELINGSTYVPIRFIAEATGAKVDWDNQTKTVVITSNGIDYSNWVPYSTSDMSTLLTNILKGNVVYYNGQYLASPEFFKLMSNENIVYNNDISDGTPSDNRYELTEIE